MSTIKYCCDLDIPVVQYNCDQYEWTLESPEGKWNIYWASVVSMKKYFTDSNVTLKLNNHQLINHFSNYFQLSRKDYIYKNICRYRDELEKKKSPYAKIDKKGNYVHLGFMPLTFVLPAEYKEFEEFFKKNPNSIWIVKPGGRSQGIGIFLVNKLSQLRKWSHGTYPDAIQVNHIVSRYIDNPFLIGGKKFDLRLYVLVLSFRPLVIYVYKLGFCRFCQLKYTNDVAKLENLFIHLTNVTIQRQGNGYSFIHGGKWSIRSFKLYLVGIKGQEMADKLFSDINSLIVHSLKATAPYMVQDPHCFELYGYDVIISNDYKPWLIEVNASPSLVTTTENDRIMKSRLVSDIFNIMCPGNKVPDIRHLKEPDESNIGDFELLYNEKYQKEDEKAM